MKLIKTTLILVLCIIWICVTNYKSGPLNSVGELLSYKTGLLSVPLSENGLKYLESDYKPKVYVDNHGIPHIYGDHQNDAAFGLGYMHAKERYFQMELITRTVQGKMSEILSDKTLGSDNFWRPYEFERKSVELLEEYKTKSPAFYEYIQAYAAGVNEYLLNNDNTDPLYKAIGVEPQAWKPEYSLLATWYMSYTLTYFNDHIKHQEIISELPEKEMNYFYPMKPENLKTILPSAYDNTENLKTEERLLQEVIVSQNINKFTSPNKFHKGVGSNNWSVSKLKTDNQATMLANDPHLFLTLPEAFYEAHLILKDLNVYGFSIPGVPVIVSGHNDEISWGITNGEWDLIDKYQLKVKDDMYYYEGEWIPIDEKQYTIKVKGFDDYILTQKNTVHGKVLKEGDQYYSEHWYASSKSYSIEAMYNMMKSKNWDHFTGALKEYGYPPQNFIYSDIDDNIGIVCAGQLPERDSDYRGGLLDGTVTYVPSKFLDTLWQTYNPEKKFLFSANQQPIQNDTYFGHHGLKDDYRAERIYTLLAENNDWQLEDIQNMQSDQLDLSFNDFKSLLEKYTIKERNTKIVDMLKGWDGIMDANSSEALAYEAIRILTEMEAQKFAKKQLEVTLAPSFQQYVRYLKDDNYIVSGDRSKEERINDILEKTDSLLTNRFGKQWEATTYESASKFSINNILSIPGLGEEIEHAGGNTNTINLNTKGIHPVYRAVYYMEKDNIKAYTILAGGQSGNVNSIHYKDQLQLWKEGKHKETQFENNPNRLKNIENIIFFK